MQGKGRRSGLRDGVNSDAINQVGDTGCSSSFEVMQEVAMGGDGGRGWSKKLHFGHVDLEVLSGPPGGNVP